MRKDLFEYMFDFLTEERQERFNTVVNNRTKHVTVVLEDLFQMHNASAVLRSCDCFGIQNVHIIENRNEYKLNKEIDMGSTKWLHVNKYSEKKNNTIDCINHNQKFSKLLSECFHEKRIPIFFPIRMFLTKKTVINKWKNNYWSKHS